MLDVHATELFLTNIHAKKRNDGRMSHLMSLVPNQGGYSKSILPLDIEDISSKSNRYDIFRHFIKLNNHDLQTINRTYNSWADTYYNYVSCDDLSAKDRSFIWFMIPHEFYKSFISSLELDSGRFQDSVFGKNTEFIYFELSFYRKNMGKVIASSGYPKLCKDGNYRCYYPKNKKIHNSFSYDIPLWPGGTSAWRSNELKSLQWNFRSHHFKSLSDKLQNLAHDEPNPPRYSCMLMKYNSIRNFVKMSDEDDKYRYDFRKPFFKKMIDDNSILVRKNNLELAYNLNENPSNMIIHDIETDKSVQFFLSNLDWGMDAVHQIPNQAVHSFIFNLFKLDSLDYDELSNTLKKASLNETILKRFADKKIAKIHCNEDVKHIR